MTVVERRPPDQAIQSEPWKGLRVCVVARREPGTTGTSRYSDQLAAGLVALHVQLVPRATHPAGPAGRLLARGRRFGLDLNAFLGNYPVYLRWPEADIYHLTVQTYASVLHLCPPPGPVVVTVHDIIPYLTRADRRLDAYRHVAHRRFDALAMRGLRRADALIADSRWTKETLVRELGLPPGKITHVPLGVDRDRFRAMDVPASFRDRYRLPSGHPYILYVGSEDPRKNLDTLLAALALIHRRYPAARLIKVGTPQISAWRHRLLTVTAELGIGSAVRFVDHVPDEDLPHFYNLASVCALPSLYEGFGLPVVEALACGTPVVSSDRASLAELGAIGAVTVPPTPSAFAAALEVVLAEEATNGRDATRRTTSSAPRSWAECSRDVLSVYRAVLDAAPDGQRVESPA